MKFTAFITTTSANTVSRKLTSSTRPSAHRWEREICSCPNQAMIPAATNLRAELDHPVEVPQVVGHSDQHDEQDRTQEREHGTGSVQKIEK